MLQHFPKSRSWWQVQGSVHPEDAHVVGSSVGTARSPGGQRRALALLTGSPASPEASQLYAPWIIVSHLTFVCLASALAILSCPLKTVTSLAVSKAPWSTFFLWICYRCPQQTPIPGLSCDSNSVNGRKWPQVGALGVWARPMSREGRGVCCPSVTHGPPLWESNPIGQSPPRTTHLILGILAPAPVSPCEPFPFHCEMACPRQKSLR